MLLNEELDLACAYTKNLPIRQVSQILPQKIINTYPMNSDWKSHIANNWWGTGFAGEMDEQCQRMMPLRDILLSFGGEETCFTYEDRHLEQILERGQLWYGDRVIKMRADPVQYYDAGIRNWYVNRKLDGGNRVRFACGYALSSDGMWRKHSWCIQVDEKGIKVMEASDKRLLYFGVLFNDDDCMKIYNLC